MEIRSKYIEQLEKDKPKAKCRKWRLWVITDHGRKSRRFTGTYTQAQKALDDFASELEMKIPNADTFAAYARSWFEYRRASGELAPNTIKNNERAVNKLCNSPLGGRRLDEITPQTCRDDLAWIKNNPLRIDAPLSGTTMNDYYGVMNMIFTQAHDDERMASNPLDKIKPPKKDTKEKEAVPWETLMSALDKLDEMPLCGFVIALYSIICFALRRSEACAFSDDEVTEDFLFINHSVSETTGKLGDTKSKAGQRQLPMIMRFYYKAEEWKKMKKALGFTDTKTLACNTIGGVMHPQNLRRWFSKHSKELGLEGVSLHQLRHSNLTHVARHMSVFDLMNYAGWSSLAPARVYIHEDLSSLTRGVNSAWGIE